MSIKKLAIEFVVMFAMTLTACTVPQVKTPEPVATDDSQVNMPNPAAAYCEQNGYEHDIRNADDGSQSGVCVFPDGSTCDEWAYFRGECSPGAQASSTPAIAVEATTEADGGSSDGNASGGYMPPGTSEEITDWWGFIKSTPPGAQVDDYFERQYMGQVITFGIDSLVPEVKAQIEALRDSSKIVHLYGTLLSNVPDYNGSQIQVDRIMVE